ncbi:SPOR domain-containing protein [Paeniglutamicibacter sp.]|uniref:SPOR domain-containing protein n=1 Tax=Paeniglutamicibacter sp. TaxID=1934391 RepID=UPI003989101A
MSGALPGEGEFWFNVTTGQVETGPQADWSQLLGPYASRAEAELAMSKVRERNEQWDEEDEEDEED